MIGTCNLIWMINKYRLRKKLLVDTPEQSSWYFLTQVSLDLNPGALDARRISVSSPFPPQLWRQNTLATQSHFLSNTAVLAKRTW
jgi:hypothetical protein